MLLHAAVVFHLLVDRHRHAGDETIMSPTSCSLRKSTLHRSQLPLSLELTNEQSRHGVAFRRRTWKWEREGSGRRRSSGLIIMHGRRGHRKASGMDHYFYSYVGNLYTFHANISPYACTLVRAKDRGEITDATGAACRRSRPRTRDRGEQRARTFSTRFSGFPWALASYDLPLFSVADHLIW